MIAEIIKKHGCASLAKKLGEKNVQIINNWARRGVPLERVVDFCEAVNYEVTPHNLYPKNYPNPNDGLPEHLRAAA